jgi:hypothetical protein
MTNTEPLSLTPLPDSQTLTSDDLDAEAAALDLLRLYRGHNRSLADPLAVKAIELMLGDNPTKDEWLAVIKHLARIGADYWDWWEDVNR